MLKIIIDIQHVMVYFETLFQKKTFYISYFEILFLSLQHNNKY